MKVGGGEHKSDESAGKKTFYRALPLFFAPKSKLAFLVNVFQMVGTVLASMWFAVLLLKVTPVPSHL